MSTSLDRLGSVAAYRFIKVVTRIVERPGQNVLCRNIKVLLCKERHDDEQITSCEEIYIELYKASKTKGHGCNTLGFDEASAVK